MEPVKPSYVIKYYSSNIGIFIQEECSCCNGYGYIVKSISSNFEKEWGNGNYN